MTMELDNKWHFFEHLGEGNEVSLNDSSTLTFNRDVWNSLVRESIQNSLDAVDRDSEPVKVSFSFNHIDPHEWPNFMQLKEHMQGCIDLFTDNDALKDFYNHRIHFLEEAMTAGKLWYLEIMDSNTTGMTYHPGESRGPFYSFVLCQGNSEKRAGNHGGSFGIGKAAYFNASFLRTVLVSSMDQDRNVAFCGVVRLSTHKFEGTKRCNQGFYNLDGKTTLRESTDQHDIPAIFHMDRPGSRFCIMGIQKGIIKDGIEGIRRGVVRNFFQAIAANHLEVKINVEGETRVTIDNSDTDNNIAGHIANLYPNKTDQIRSMSNFNPRGYFEAVKLYDGANPDIRLFEEELEDLGTVRLYLKSDPEGKGGTAFMRRNLMLVERVTRKRNPFFSTFICDNVKGDELLGTIEPPSHDNWDPNCFRDKDTRPDEYRRRRDAYKRLMEWIDAKIDTVFVPAGSTHDSMDKLREYVSMPLTEDEADQQSDAALGLLAPDPDWKGEDPNAPTNRKIDDKHPDNTPSSKTRIMNTVDGPFSPGDGDYGAGSRHKGDTPPGPGPEPKPNVPGKQPVTPDPKGRIKKARSKNAAHIRMASFTRAGEIWHRLLVRVDRDMNNATLQLKVGADQGSADLCIDRTSAGRVRGNSIGSLSLKAGIVNEIEVKFADNMRHSLITTLK